jgi:hypothetical protein
VAFPGSTFNGAIIPRLLELVESSTITIVDGVFAMRDAEGVLSWHELQEADPQLVALLDRVDGLLSDEDIADLAGHLDPGSSAAILAFEHTWMKPLRDAVAGSGGVLLADVQIPGFAVEEILTSVPDEN